MPGPTKATSAIKTVTAPPSVDATPSKAFDFTAIAPTVASELPKQRKSEKENPLLAIVKHSVDNDFKPFNYGPVPNDLVGKAKNLMHRAAKELGYGLSVRTIDNGNATSTVVYQAKREKKERKYTTVQVRSWVKAQQEAGETFPGYSEDKRIPADTLKRYRTEHNI